MKCNLMLFDMFPWGDRAGNPYLAHKLCIYMHNTKYTKIKAKLIKYAVGKKKILSKIPGY